MPLRQNAQLKARPGRQTWELAPDFFKQTAFMVDAETAAAREGPLQMRVDLATRLKQEGNQAFNQNPSEALKMYVKAIAVFMWFDRGKDRASEDIPLVNTLDGKAVQEAPEELEKAAQLAATCFSNAALCLLRQQQLPEAIYACSKALALDPDCVKARFRRAEAHHQLGTRADLEQSVKDLQEALQLEPGNTQVRVTLAKYQTELREQNRRERQMCTGMFQGGALYEENAQEIDCTAAARDDDFPAQPASPSKPMEAERAMRSIQRNLARVKSQEKTNAGRSGLSRRHDFELQQQQPSPFLKTLSCVPWWGWVLIICHLSYRIYKLLIFPGRRGIASGVEGGHGDSREL